MATAVADAIKRRNPDCKITLVTRYPELFASHQSICEVLSDNVANRNGAHVLSYGQGGFPPPRPIATMMAECVGLRVSEILVANLPEPLVAKTFRDRFSEYRRPLIVVQPQASRWTPNKDWSVARWNSLVERLVEQGTVVECGTERLLSDRPDLVCLAGTTNVQQFAWVVRHADLFIGPPSGGMHLAAAFRAPSVILFGGYEHPDGYRYPNVVPFYSAVSCAPCWLTTGCPIGRVCLEQIAVDDVYKEALKALGK